MTEQHAPRSPRAIQGATDVVTARFADNGFSPQEWSEFERDGLIVRRGVFDPHEVATLRDCCRQFEKVASATLGKADGAFRNCLGIFPQFGQLVCDVRLLALAYDLFGEMTTLHGFDLFIRPTGGAKRHPWHFDGPRRLPFSAFSSDLPLVLKFGIWLTDVDDPAASAYQYVPGSHRESCEEAYLSSQEIPGTKTLTVQAGDVSIHHCDLWHRVSANEKGATRYNFFVAYAPSWLASREPFDEVETEGAPPTLGTLLRCYDDPTRRVKPPTDETPLHPAAPAALLDGTQLGRPPIFSLKGKTP